MEALAAFAPAVAEVDILMDMGLIEIDQVMALIARAIQQRADLGNKSLPLVGIGASEQLASFLPGQVQRHAFGVLTSGGSLRDGAGRGGWSRGRSGGADRGCQKQTKATAPAHSLAP